MLFVIVICEWLFKWSFLYLVNGRCLETAEELGLVVVSATWYQVCIGVICSLKENVGWTGDKERMEYVWQNVWSWFLMHFGRLELLIQWLGLLCCLMYCFHTHRVETSLPWTRVWATNFGTYTNFVKIQSTCREFESQKYFVRIVRSHFLEVSFLLSVYGQNYKFFCCLLMFHAKCMKITTILL